VASPEEPEGGILASQDTRDSRLVEREKRAAVERYWREKAGSMTPVEVHAKLLELVNDEARAVLALRRARDAETDAFIGYKKARVLAYAREDCPRPSRGGVTVGERDAWVERVTFDEWEVLRRAEGATENATDYVKQVDRTSTKVQTIARLVEQAYNMAGRTNR